MEMRVSDGLTGGFTDVDANVVAVRCPASLDVSSHRCDQGPYRSLLLRAEGEKIWLVPARNNEAMARIQREGVKERHR
jgi:hypothetical protein